MKTTILCVAFLGVGIWTTTPCLADDGYKQFFHSVANTLAQQDQQTIYSALELEQASKGKFTVSNSCEVAGKNFKIQLHDINGDGIAEVFVMGGNTCTSGVTGSSLWLFVKSKQQGYHMNLGFPSADYKLLPTKHMGFPDIQIGAAGICEAVWRWNGQVYDHYKDVPVAAGGC
ncbi:MAG TPA: hypothetical protein VIE65_04860 [Methylobacter sp.]|jgi:hypothetical protein